VLFVSVLHFVGGAEAGAAVARYIGAAAPGSYLVLSHATSDADADASAAGMAVYAGTANPSTLRPREEILAFFGGLDLLEPGLVPVQQWRPDEPGPAGIGRSWILGGVGRCLPGHVQAPLPEPADSVPRPQIPQQRDSAGHEGESGPAVADRQPPPGIDASVATAARMYDYWLGGHNNFAADRRAALKISELLAGEAGIRQFLDLGTGLPTTGNVHQVAQAINPASRVVYVDNDPMVLAHARALKTGEHTAVIHADLRDADAILGHPDTRRLLDFTQPLAVLLVSVLHFVASPDAGKAVTAFTGAAPPGSYLALSHGCSDPNPDVAEAGKSVYADTANRAASRPRAEILEFFAGLQMVEPGLVPVQQWRPREDDSAEPGRAWMLGGVGHKPA
jgi:hypothetical protein